MPPNDDEEFVDEEFDDEEDNRFTWQINAERAVDRALEEAEFDDVRGSITIQDLDYSWVEYRSVEELMSKLIELYNDGWYGSVPFDSGEAVFEGDAYGYVGDALAHHDVEDFYMAIHDPDDADEIITSRELIDDVERSKLLRIDLQEISDELIRYLARHPHLMRNLDPRKFEELVAELLRDKGYEVELTPRTRDGGLDIIAIK
jgi:CRISPR/Cas system Type II protein with McrA/HNH and RuvC-like nuclease domain